MMNVQQTVQTIYEQASGEISEVYLVACGGSLVDMYPSKYFWIVKQRSW